jgi:hypothetical protein
MLTLAWVLTLYTGPLPVSEPVAWGMLAEAAAEAAGLWLAVGLALWREGRTRA